MILALLDDGRKLHYKHLTFYLEDDKKLQRLVSLPTGKLKQFLSRIRLATRFFRLEPRCIAQLSKDIFIVCVLHKVWVLNIKDKALIQLTESRPGFSDPLNLCSDGTFVYYGDYGNNIDRDSVNIYRISQSLSVDIVFQFAQGSIRHIHNVVYDKDNQRYWILTGDTEKKSGIYLANYDWTEVRSVVVGDQSYRAVIGFPYCGGLLYATDAVDKSNHIFLLKDGTCEMLSELNGSCIHGVETKSHFVFSTTVEPPEGRGFLNLFTYKLGNGIKSRESHIVAFNKEMGKVEILKRLPKDIWPMKLFQYGMCLFPIGQKMGDVLHYEVMACKGDGKMSIVELFNVCKTDNKVGV